MPPKKSKKKKKVRSKRKPFVKKEKTNRQENEHKLRTHGNVVIESVAATVAFLHQEQFLKAKEALKQAYLYLKPIHDYTEVCIRENLSYEKEEQDDGKQGGEQEESGGGIVQSREPGEENSAVRERTSYPSKQDREQEERERKAEFDASDGHDRDDGEGFITEL